FRVFYEGDTLLGYLAATIRRDDPAFGVAGGMDLVLAPSLRNRGVGRWAYGEILAYLDDADVRVLKGGTSQPPVLRLAQQMGRVAHGMFVRHGVPFERGHFMLDTLAPR